MHSPTSLEGSRLVRTVVLCAQTRLLGPRGHRDVFLSSSERRISTGLLRPLSSSKVRPRSLLHSEFEHCSYSWPAVRGVVYTIIA